MQHCAVILLVLTNTPDPLSIAVDCMALCAESSLFFFAGHCRCLCERCLSISVHGVVSLELTSEIKSVPGCCSCALHVCVAVYAKLQMLQDTQFG